MGEILKNEYLVNTLKTKKINDNYYFLMENMELGNLKTFNENTINNNCSELLCSFFIYQCLLGLYYMHKNLIVHRDLKLENILLNKKYQIKLADFSMCSQLKKNTLYPISRSGTVPYLPPESFPTIKKNSIINKKLGVQSTLKKDMFALGIVMYRLLFKEHPFKYEYKMHREEYSVRLKKIKPSYKGKYITKDCKIFIRGLLMKNVNKRLSIIKALKHRWIIKTQNIIKLLMKKNKNTQNFNLITELNNFIMDEDIEQVSMQKIFDDFSSTKESEDKELLNQKRNRDIDSLEDYKYYN